MAEQSAKNSDPFLSKYQPSELRIASEFLATWLPFLSRDLCHNCTQSLSDRIRSLDPGIGAKTGSAESSKNENSNGFAKDIDNNDDNCDTNSLGSWKDAAESISIGFSEQIQINELASGSSLVETPSPRKSWADMAQEDEMDEEDERDSSERLFSADDTNGELISKGAAEKPKLSRDEREHIRFMNVQRNKDFICFERINGKLTNILQGLELHTGVFSAAEQKRIVDFVDKLKEMGKNGELKERTYTAPTKWMRGKGRITIQFGCCYNYTTDKKGNPPGILQNEMVDPIPHLFKVMIRRLIKWHVLPPTCVPDSCIVNIYEEGDCIPPHIDNHDFVRPFCTISFLSECNIVFGSNIKVEGPGDFSGQFAIPLPVGSVLVLNGNGADVAKHCVPAVPTKRISITFRRMDETKRPTGFVPEPDLQGIQPLPYEVEKKERSTEPRYVHRNGSKQQPRREIYDESRGSADRKQQPRREVYDESRGSADRKQEPRREVYDESRGSADRKRQPRREVYDESRGSGDWRGTRSEPGSFTQNRRGSLHRPRVRVSFDSQ